MNIFPTNEKSVHFKTPSVLGPSNALIEGLAEGCLKIVCDRRNQKTLLPGARSYSDRAGSDIFKPSQYKDMI